MPRLTAPCDRPVQCNVGRSMLSTASCVTVQLHMLQQAVYLLQQPVNTTCAIRVVAHVVSTGFKPTSCHCGRKEKQHRPASQALVRLVVCLKPVTYIGQTVLNDYN